MRRTFPLHDLSNDEFELLVVAICFHILGTGTVTFATGKDGGRDAAFAGTATKFPSAASPLSGKFIVQAKHTSNPVASCSDKEFDGILEGEHPKISKLVAGGELEHYIVVTNRKKPATKSIEKEQALCSLGLKTAQLIGIEQIRAWLTQHPEIWKNLGFDRFDAPLRIQIKDITDVITAFHSSIVDGKIILGDGTDFTYVSKPKKNKINKLSDAYFDELLTRSLPFFKPIEDFLSNPRNIDFKDQYEDTVDEIRQKTSDSRSAFRVFRRRTYLHRRSRHCRYLDLKMVAPWDYRTGVSYFLRTQADYTEYFQIQKFMQGKDRAWKPYLAGILGLDHEAVSQKYELEDEITAKISERDKRLAEIDVTNLDRGELVTRIEIAQDEISEIDARLDGFDFHEVELQINKRVVDAVEARIF